MVAAMAEMLGLGSEANAGALWMADTVRSGLPVSALDRVVHAVSPHDPSLRFHFVPRATLARRLRTNQRLSTEESDKLARVAAVFVLAREVWGSAEEARDFLSRRHPLLDDQTPLAVAMATELGGKLVEKILCGLKYGTAA